MSNSDCSQTKKVAVIAVHGVSDQQPFNSAREVANLLVNPKTNQKENYTPFYEQFIRMVVNPVIKKKQNTKNKQDENKALDINSIETQLASYNESSVYNTICLKGEGKFIDSNARQVSKEVHIYEMYWADLSRLGTGFIRIFGELYQLIFHFSVLGDLVIDLGQSELTKDTSFYSKFKTFNRFHKSAVWILTLPIPILNLYLLIAAFLGIPFDLSEQYLPLITKIAISLLLTIVLSGYLFLYTKYKYKYNVWFWFLFPLIVGLISVLIIHKFMNQWTYYLIGLVWLGLLIFIVYKLLIAPYNRYRPGAFLFYLVSGSVLLISVISLFIIAGHSTEELTKATLNLMEIIYFVLYVFWNIFNFLYFFLILPWGIYLRIKIKQNNQLLEVEKLKLDRSIWVGIITLILPSFLFLILSLTLWSAVNNLGSSLLKHINYIPLIFTGLGDKYLPDSSSIEISDKLQKVNSSFCPDSHYQSDCFLQLLSDFSGSPLAPIALLFFAFTLIVAIWALFPAILTDIFPPSSGQNNSYSQNLGFWLSNGFVATVNLLFLCFGILIPLLAFLGIGLSFEYFFGWDFFVNIYSNLGELLNINFSWLMELSNNNLNRSILNIAVGVLTASAGTLIAFGSRLNKISLGLRGVLDAALDVDNYLRLEPKDNTTRGQIFARYVSLLKYLLNCKDSQNQNTYDAIVIIAHSQGTVITADLLRFLQQNKNYLSSCLGTKESNIPDIYLFTMGSPIRQLYSFAFPHLYHWVYNESESQNTTPQLPDSINPDPEKLLKVQQWVNAYRSGDYIGRYLWRSPNDPNLWQKVDFSKPEKNISQSEDRKRREFCIGAGGHTHYWDETAPDIAYEIDRLIGEV